MGVEWKSRTELLLGIEGVEKLESSNVLVVGIGGVGGAATEMLVRAGIGNITIVDADTVNESNINRQLNALRCTVGLKKVEVTKKRMKDINPEIIVISISERLTSENISGLIPQNEFLYAIDAIDEIDSKTSLIAELVKRKIPFGSSMGAGSRLDSSKIRVEDISRTEYCPLARIMRKRLQADGIHTGVRCIYATENLNKVREPEDGIGKRLQGSISFMPGIFGLTAAGVIINDIINR